MNQRSWLIIAITLLLATGCAKQRLGDDEITYRYGDRASFEKRSSLRFDLDRNAMITHILLFEPRLTVQFMIPLFEVKDINFVRLKESRNLNIDRLLIPGGEYFWDRKVRRLLVQLQTPLVYFVEGSAAFEIEIAGDFDGEAIELKRMIVFHWKPMRERADAALSFEYGNALGDEFMRINRQKYAPLLREELLQTNAARFSAQYQKRLQLLKEWAQ